MNHLKQLEIFSQIRDKELGQIQEKVKRIHLMKKSRCRFGWKCSRGPACQYDHVYLYSKVSQNLKYSDSSTTISEPDFFCVDMYALVGVVM